MKTLLVNFTESEKRGRKFIYTDYSDVVVFQENENDNLVFVKEVGHKKRLSSLNIEIELKGNRTKEELLKAKEKKDKKELEERKKKERELSKERKARKVLIKIAFKKALNLTKFTKKYEQLLCFYENVYSEEKRDEILKTLVLFKKINKSPYSNSFYDSNEIDWDYKPENSLRLSDHWNFYSQGEKHCCLDCTDEYTKKWLLCQYRKGVYHVIKEI